MISFCPYLQDWEMKLLVLLLALARKMNDRKIHLQEETNLDSTNNNNKRITTLLYDPLLIIIH